MEILLKRVYDSSLPAGFRVLADRLWPRGVKKETLTLDVWAKEIAPSTSLRKAYHQNADYQSFKKLYTKELQQNPVFNDFLKGIRGQEVVVLLTASKIIEKSALPILKEVLQERLLLETT